MNPKQFLIIGGIVLVVVGLAGAYGIIGPTPEKSIFGATWWFDSAENWAHLVLGVAALVVAFALGGLAGVVTLLVGILGVLVALYNLYNTSLLGANLESPADLILHLVVGLWALWAWWSGRKMMMPPSSMMR